MNNFGTLFIVATPIGNMGDVSSRAIDTLSTVNKIYTEDSRVGKKLLNSLNINNPNINSYHAHSDDYKKDLILKDLIDGVDVVLITDAGTPAISDPGNELIDYLLSREPDLKIRSVPGPSSVTAAISISGFRANTFLFLGFVPKKKQSAFFEKIKNSEDTVVYFDSPHRVYKNLKLLSEIIDNKRRVFIAREITKLHETHYRGPINQVIDSLSKESHLKGEIVVIIEGN